MSIGLRRHLPAGLLAAVLLCGLFVLLGTAAGTTPPWGPVLGHVTPTSVQISWREGRPAAEGIVFGGTLYRGDIVETNYRLVTLTGLRPDTEYAYLFRQGKRDHRYRFTTAPAGSTDFTFAVYGDTRTQLNVHRQVVRSLTALRPRFVINTGDLVTHGDRPKEWTDFFSVATPLTATAPYFVAAGNHEKNHGYFFRTFPGAPGGGMLGREWYAFTYGHVRVIILNSTREVAAQRAWLAEELAAHAGSTPWTVVAFHYPPFSSSARGGDALLREQWVPLLEQYQVDAVFLGHDHFYERSHKDGVTYLISGGGGAPLYAPNVKPNPYQQYAERVHHYVRADVTATSLHLRMYRVDGTLGDEVRLTKAATAP